MNAQSLSTVPEMLSQGREETTLKGAGRDPSYRYQLSIPLLPGLTPSQAILHPSSCAITWTTALYKPRSV